MWERIPCVMLSMYFKVSIFYVFIVSRTKSFMKIKLKLKVSTSVIYCFYFQSFMCFLMIVLHPLSPLFLIFLFEKINFYTYW